VSIQLAEVSLQRLIQIGLANLRSNEEAFKNIFDQYNSPEMASSYGTAYIQKIWDWYSNGKMPVVQAWAFDSTRVPGFSIHLADESEDESKIAFGDHFGMGEDSDILTGPVSVSIDIGIHADKAKDHVLWMYYILLYILYREKMVGQRLGLQVYTYRASDYTKESKYMADNVWSRWVRFRCTVQHYVPAEEAYITPDIELDIQAVQTTGDDIVDISHILIENEDDE
jgi:hypothetical protein